MFRKLLQQRSAASPLARRRLAFEPLEPRLLLSADLLPVEGVLGITGTEGADSLLLQQRDAVLLVVLNNETFEISLAGIERIEVDLGGGADAMILEGSTALPAVQIDLGEGDNRFDAVLEDPDGVLEVVSGGGDDRVGVQASWAKTQHPDFLWLPTVKTGAGNDIVDFSVVMGIEPLPFLPAIKIEMVVDAGDGNDIARVDTLLGGESAEAVYRLDMGEGDNETFIVFGDGVQGARLPSGDSNVRTEYRSGAGADTVCVQYTLFLPDGTPTRASAFGLDVVTGGGHDTVDVAADLTESGDSAVSATLDIAINLGAGLDLKLAADGRSAGIFANVETAERGATVRTEVLGGGDDSADASTIFYVLDMSGSSGDDILDFAASGVFEEMQLAVDMGDGNDTVMFNPTELKVTKSAQWQIDTGAGDDRLVVETSGVHLAAQSRVQWLVDMGAGDDDVTHIRANWEIDAGVDYRWAVDLGEGDDGFKASVDGQSVGDRASVAYEFSGGDGDDDIHVAIANLSLGLGSAFAMKTDAGDGDNLVGHELAHVWQQTDGTVPPPDDGKPVELHIAAGSGSDVFDVNVVMGIEPSPFLPAIQLDLLSGGGDDTVLVGLLLPAVQGAREAVHRANIDLGGGNDFAGLSIETINAGAGINPCCIVGIDAGLGGDEVQVDVRGDFDVFDLRADMGADTSGDVVPVDQISLNYTAIKFEYSTRSTHTYDYQSGDGARAVYHAGLRSDGDLVQAVSEADTVGGLVFDQVNVEIGVNRTQTVGANMTISVGGAQAAVERGDLGAAYSLATTLGGADGAAMQGDVVLKRGLGGNSLTLDLGMNDVPTRAGFANVTGLTTEVTPVEYRAGAEIGDDLTLNIDMSGVDAFHLLTGSADDEIDIDLVHPTFPVPMLTIATGGGDDDVGLDYTDAAAIVTGAGMGGLSEVKAFSGASGVAGDSFLAYGSQFTGGVRVATGDVNNDGVADIITGAGPGGGPHVKVFDGRGGGELRSFFAYDPQFTGGVFVAAGDVNGDGFADIITGADAGGGPHVKVFDGQSGTELSSFFAYSSGFTGGVRVASGDVNGDGFDDIITGAGAGGGPHVKVFDGRSGSELRSFFAYDAAFSGGVFVAAGDVDGDGFDDIITGAGAGGGPHVKVFDGSSGSEVRSFFAYSPSFTGGVRVAAGDVNGDGRADIVTGAGPGAGPHVKVFDGSTGAEVRSFFAYDPGFTGGVYVAAGDVDSNTPGNLDLAVDVGDGNDTIKLGLVTGGSRSDRIDALLGDGADRFELDWSGALRDPSVNLQVEVNVDPGGSGFLPEIGDEVLVSFEQGDLDRPFVIGALWNSKDVPPPDDQKPPPDDQHLRMSLASSSGVLSSSLDLLGGAGDDDVTYFVRGTLDAVATEVLGATIDLGDGTNTTTITYTGLESEGPKKLAPISVDVRGGKGEDKLAIFGTEGNDLFTLTESAVILEGAGRTSFAGFESVQLYALGGNDRVTMTGLDPRIDWLIDGGAGHDQFLADFALDRNPMLVGFEKVKTRKPAKLR